MSHVDEGQLHAYLDGACSDLERERIEGHVAECPECHARLDEAAALAARASSLLADLEPGAARAPAWRELEARAATRARARPGGRWLRPSLAWAAVIVIAFGVGWLSNSMLLAPAPFDLAPVPVRQVVGEVADEVGASPPDGSEEPGPAPGTLQRDASEAKLRESQAVDVFQARRREVETADAIAPGRSGERVAAKSEAEAEAPANRLARTNEAETPPAEPPVAYRRLDDQAREVLRARSAEALAARAPADADAAGLDAPRTEAPEAEAQKAVESELTGFFVVSAEAAALWLGGDLRVLPDLRLERVEVGPGAAVEGAVSGLPAARLVYEDAAGHEILLIQQRLGDRSGGPPVSEPVMTVDPTGLRTYRWEDDKGYLLILTGSVSGDSLRALSVRIR